MATFTADTNWNKTFSGSDFSVSAAKTITISTKGTYLDRDIAITIPKATDITGTGTCTVSGGGLSKGTASGGGLSKGTASGGVVSSSTTDIVGTNVGVATTDTYGCGIKVVASSSASSTAFSQTVTRAAFSQTVSRAAVTDVHTAGYITAGTTTPIAADSTTVSLGSDTATVSLAAGSATSSRTEYVNSLTIPAAKTFGSSSAKGAITLTAGTSTSALTGAYLTMNTNTVLYLTDAVTGKTWTIKCDSANNALSIEQ